MSVRSALLTLVGLNPAGVYRLKQDFEQRTGGIWPLNIGQVYQTMQRLERDMLVVAHAEANGGRDLEVYEATEAGIAAVEAWFRGPVPRGEVERDELVMKLVIARSDPLVDVGAIIESQREATHAALVDLIRLRDGVEGTEPARWLVIDRQVLRAQAELEWLRRAQAVLDHS